MHWTSGITSYLLILTIIFCFRNHDGFLTKGELKLANKDATMSDVMQVPKEFFLYKSFLLEPQILLITIYFNLGDKGL